ncbi:MAG: S-methyl-5-thioribose-1-phosphate isomerase [Candidatus Omnitrophica bacterium]|nr:S-methyl-5-thioribose-1-phosphate isomerase [Candidatus Omnitrophota bacterium]
MATNESPLFWPAYIKDKVLYVLDETLIPTKVKYIPVKNTKEAVKVIREMKTRAFGQFLVVLNTFLVELKRNKLKGQSLVQAVEKIAQALNASRPTFPFADVTSIVVGWTHKAFKEDVDISSYLEKNIEGFIQGIRYRRLERVAKIAALTRDGDSVLTHCNVSGELAMAAALCQKEKKAVKFFATETRPYFQGAKLTAWELNQVGTQVTLVADNAIASLMKERLVNRVIIGSDRSCANGDIANKIGSYQIAVCAKEFGIPLCVLTQPSNTIKQGKDIPIELRDPKELLSYEGKKIYSPGVKGFYPGFDVVPHELITQSIAIKAGA